MKDLNKGIYGRAYGAALDAAEETLAMHRELMELRAEVAELRQYRDKYIDELHRGISHSQHMIGGLLELAMKPGVLPAIAKANAKEATHG